MVRRIFSFLSKEILGLHQAALLLGFFALSSQILALVRDRLLAHVFGAGVELDIYYAAFRIPDFIFITVASLVSVSILVPFLVERLETGTESARYFIRQVFTFFFVVIVAVSVCVFLFAPIILGVVFPGFVEGEREVLVFLTRVMLLSPILLGISNLLGGISQTRRRFFLYALSPVLYNVGIIVGILAFAPVWGITGVALGVVLGAVLHAAIHIPFVMREGLFPTFSLRLDLPLLWSVAALALPRTFTLGITHVVIIILLALASLMTEGSITVFSFSFNLQSVVLSIVGVSYSLAAFPTIARFFAEGKRKEFLEYVVASAQHIVFWSVPAAVLFIVLRAQIVRTVLGTGEFDWEATQLTAAGLALFAASVVFQGLILLFVKSYYAMGNTALPLLVNVAAGVVSVGSAFGLTFLFHRFELFRFFIESLLRVEGVAGTEILMLPFGFSIGMAVNGVVLWALFGRRFTGFSVPVLTTLSQSFAAAVLGGVGAYVSLAMYGLFIDLDTFFAVFFQGTVAGLFGIGTAVLVLVLLDNREIRIVVRVLKRKFKGVWVFGPDADVVQ